MALCLSFLIKGWEIYFIESWWGFNEIFYVKDFSLSIPSHSSIILICLQLLSSSSSSSLGTISLQIYSCLSYPIRMVSWACFHLKPFAFFSLHASTTTSPTQCSTPPWPSVMNQMASQPSADSDSTPSTTVEFPHLQTPSLSDIHITIFFPTSLHTLMTLLLSPTP